MASLELLYQQLAYLPEQPELFEQALTHRSFSRDHNERLEYLGDAVLDLVIGEALYHHYPTHREGELSRFRAVLVNGQYLAEKAKQLQLNGFIRLGSGERKAGGSDRESILAGAFEALLGALYLDASYERTKAIILHLFAEDLLAIAKTAQRKDGKTQLQELLQSAKHDLPDYQLVKTSGQDHQQTFTIRCEVANLALSATATGSSKKIAEQNAAESMLRLLEQRKIS